MRPEPLDRERGLRLGAVARKALADEAQLERRNLAIQDAAQEAVLAESPHQRPVEAPGLTLAGECRERVAGEHLGVAQQLYLFLGEVGVGRAQGITAVATSSTLASSSCSAVTPSRAIAG
jgi:hypothetical protein